MPERVSRMERRAVLARRFRALVDARDAVRSELAVRNAEGVVRGGGGREFVAVDTGVSPRAAAFIDSLVRVEARHLEVSDTALQVFISGPMSDSARSSALRARRPLDITWLLPEGKRTRCLAVVRLNRVEVSNLLVASATSLLGPCAFVSRFGSPGADIRRWLAAGDYAFAAYPAWNDVGLWSSRSQEVAVPRLGLGTTQSRCVLGDLPSCRSSLALDSNAVAATDAGFVPVTFRDFSMAGPRLGRYERLFLSDMVRELGPERFGEFWRSERAADSAFATAAGHTMEEATSRWMRRFYDNTPGGPARPAPTGVALGVVLGLGLLTSHRGARRLLRGTTRR